MVVGWAVVVMAEMEVETMVGAPAEETERVAQVGVRAVVEKAAAMVEAETVVAKAAVATEGATAVVVTEEAMEEAEMVVVMAVAVMVEAEKAGAGTSSHIQCNDCNQWPNGPHMTAMRSSSCRYSLGGHNGNSRWQELLVEDSQEVTCDLTHSQNGRRL